MNDSEGLSEAVDPFSRPSLLVHFGRSPTNSLVFVPTTFFICSAFYTLLTMILRFPLLTIVAQFLHSRQLNQRSKTLQQLSILREKKKSKGNK